MIINLENILMSRIEFGTTWWGKEWVLAMERIDIDQNRLPRGKRYARNGSVRSIEIDRKEVRSRVQGSRPSPYSQTIRLTSFRGDSIQLFKDILYEHPAIEAELDLGRMPEDLKDLLEKNDLSLFPKKWNEIDAKCSCPDWANPCKHLAAVFYLIAKEIDRDPFVLFTMRGVDPSSLRKGQISTTPKNNTTTKISFLSGTARKKLIKKIPEPPPLSFDLEPVDAKGLFSLLPARPIFYDFDDFRELYRKATNRATRNLEDLSLREDVKALLPVDISFVYSEDPEDLPVVFLSGLSKLEPTFPGLRGRIENLSKPEFDGKSIKTIDTKGFIVSLSDFLKTAITLPRLSSDDGYAPGLVYFTLLNTFALGVIKSRLFIPAVNDLDDGRFRIEYHPQIHYGQIGKILSVLEDSLPVSFAFRAKDGRSLAPSSVHHPISAILGDLFRILAEYEDRRIKYDKLTYTFFEMNSEFVPESFNERSVGKSIRDWLEYLSPLGSEFSPVVRIEKKDRKQFTLHVDVENRRSSLDAPVPMASLFREDAMVFERPVEEIRPKIMRQLLIAGEKTPVLREILDSRGEFEPEIELMEMARYLSDHGRFFKAIGIRFLLPEELKDLIRPSVALKSTGESKIVSHLSFDMLMQFNPVVALGDETLTGEEFRKLMRGAEGIVEYKGKYIFFEPGEAERLMKNLEEKPSALGGADLLRAGIIGDRDGIKIIMDGPIREFFARLSVVEDERPPAGLRAMLRPYQLRGFSWLYSNYVKGLGSCLADDMGLGKTIQTIAFLLKLKEDKKLSHPALVVTPMTLLENWKKEIERFTPDLKPHIFHGQGRTLNLKGIHIVLTTYGTLHNDNEYLRKKKWSVLILDEAQAIKNRMTSRTKSVKTIRAGGYVALSGTPVENHTGELWSIFDYINRGLLGDAKDFRKEFAVPIERYRSPDAAERLRTITAPFLLRRLKTDKTIIKDLPEKMVHDDYCNLTDRQAGLYQETLHSIMKLIENGDKKDRSGLIFKLMTALKQICNHPAQFSGKKNALPAESGKLERLLELVAHILTRREKVIIFTQYKAMADILERSIADELGHRPLLFSGALTRTKRNHLVEEFQTNPAKEVMIITIRSGGTGLNLTAATHVIHYDLWWNPAVENQATDRVFRIGQKRTVQVHRFITTGTFEERINDMIRSKMELANLTVSAGEKWITELSNDELRNVFALVESNS